MKLVIVGGVAGGASAAARARRLSEDAEILLLERGPDVSFANCGLPYHIGGVIPQRDKLLVTTPERLRERFRLDVRTRSEVVVIDRRKKAVRVRDLTSDREYEETYDKLILAPGAAPIRPPVPGADLPNVFTLRALADTDRIKSLADGGIQRAVVVGAGFIGLELAENFVHRGIATTVLDRNRQVLPPFDAEMTTPLLAALREKGVEVLLGQTAEAIDPDRDGLRITLTSGDTRTAQLVVLGVGVRPENALAVRAGLEVGPRGGVRVNEYLQTTDPDIFAVGDVIETTEVGTGERTQVPLAGPANRQGRIAADNAFGRATKYRGTQGTAILGCFGTTAAMTGQSEKALQRSGRPYRKVYVHPAHHAGYYPGAEGMTLKVIFDPATGKLLGAQGVGGAGVDKRIDVLAVAVQAGMTVLDLEETELCYAPQFGSAKDPVNMAGFVAGGLLRGDHPQTDWESVAAAADKPLLLDVRTPTEFASGHIPGALNIPVDDLRRRLAELPKGRPIVAYCQVGQRGYLATRILMQAGFAVSNLGGGYKTYLLHAPAPPTATTR
ncbi:Coenzyme A disulfide reductase [Gemmata obscuriglobus]|uniref:CoA-disulfide reductase n=1 Tax=Gemmata obscuriglobus TaxID=114 RepID=A0A2Z3H3J1_9BACT|nr:FAD-dependent oxidoreductase [Gemmata obscuriglobus]AWM40583.1 CoA-disulfide reductase [Gemmata obscuriglobus]QEG26157.1 Coenzyme A disulfide reductase [Gemmata obscuriglobus]VTS00754.1 -disulfide reductase : FAD-dependent pyridine nucleotide-disulfide oxidoreductase OS=Isosphaera pallida (strain ATCC 43644 / DSM 9630 / IS1B) GN=Isop_2700 PE=4 SV=1: Pyr_redox_2: Pyr_redox: Pyr_redox_dim: Rhodanese [Gemmata obscuriglobus UQM 2246]